MDLDELPDISPEEAARLWDEIEKTECEESLYTFVKHAWKYFDPAPFTEGWHIRVICDHLEAVARGEIPRFLLNLPPRHAKSSILAVAFPCWVWALERNASHPLMGAHTQFMFASYAHSLSLRDSLKCRRLIESPWYQKHWSKRFKLTSDQNTKFRFENDKGGYRLSTSVGGSLTGEGAMIIIADDPNNAIEAESEVVRNGVIDWWDTAMSTRLNDPATGAMLVVQQRLHEDDLSGHLINQGGWDHLVLRARFDSDFDRCITKLGDVDPRTEDGEPLWPEKYGDDELATLERALGPYAASAQLQQSPAPKGGGIILREWWQPWFNPNNPNDPFYQAFPPLEYVVASLDTAYTEKSENDYSALVIMGLWRDKYWMPKVMLLRAWHARLHINDLVQKVISSCSNKHFTVDKLLIEDKAAGHSVAQEIRRLFGNEPFAIQLITPKGDKVARAYSVQHLFSGGMIYAPDTEWAELVKDELAILPKGKHDDLADACVMGLKWMRDSGWALREEEQQDIYDEKFKPKGPEEALYDI